VYQRLKESLQSLDQPETAKLRRFLVRNIENICQAKLTSYHVIATILDPRFKNYQGNYELLYMSIY